MIHRLQLQTAKRNRIQTLQKRMLQGRKCMDYHVLVLMVSAGITVEDVTRELEKRHVIDHKVKQERMQ